MKIRKHTAFREDENVELVSYLNENHIAYDKGIIISALDIFGERAEFLKELAGYLMGRKN